MVNVIFLAILFAKSVLKKCKGIMVIPMFHISCKMAYLAKDILSELHWSEIRVVFYKHMDFARRGKIFLAIFQKVPQKMIIIF